MTKTVNTYLNLLALTGNIDIHNVDSDLNHFELKTEHGLDKLHLMLRFMKILDGKRPKQDYVRFKSWIVQSLKRGLTPQEDLDLATGIYNYVKSNEATPERMDAMNYLFNAKFLVI